MSIQSISNVSFGAKTQKGNEYKKSHVGTIAGTVAGAGTGVYGAYKFGSLMKKNSGFKKAIMPALADIRNILMEAGKTKAQATKKLKSMIKAGHIANTLTWTLIGLGIGALVNKAINHAKANKADKAAAKAQ